MSMRLTRWAYESLVAENVAWLKTMPRTLERDHILMILGEAVRYEYDSDYARGVADERERVVAKLEALHAESLTLPLPQDYVDGIECAVDHLKEET